MGISVDSSPSNHVFAQQNGLTFPLLSDFHRKVSAEYGVLNRAQGFANRTTFVIDKKGIIRSIDRDSAALNPNGAHAVCNRLAHQEKGR